MDAGESLEAALAQSIARMRRDRGLSLEQLAEAAGLHRTSLGLVERGKRGLSVASATRLAHALDLRLSELVAQAESASGE